MSQTLNAAIAVIGIDIGENSFHVVGHDARGAIVLRQKWSRGARPDRVSCQFAGFPVVLCGTLWLASAETEYLKKRQSTAERHAMIARATKALAEERT